MKSGDTMTVDIDKNTVPSDLTDSFTIPKNKDNSGEIIATGTYDNKINKSPILLQIM